MRILKYILIITALSLLLSACGIKAESMISSPSGEIRAHLTLSGSSVRSIEVYAGEEQVSKYSVKGAKVDEAGNGFEFIDLNFDGTADMRLLVKDGEKKQYKCWIYNPGSGGFDTYSVLDGLKNPIVDKENGRIAVEYSTHIIEPAVGIDPEAHIYERGSRYYGWHQGKFCEVGRDCVTYYSESDIYCVAVWELNADGELYTTKERWLSPKKYAAEGGERWFD